MGKPISYREALEEEALIKGKKRGQTSIPPIMKSASSQAKV